MVSSYQEKHFPGQPIDGELCNFFAEAEPLLTSQQFSPDQASPSISKTDIEQFFSDVSFRVDLAEETQRCVDRQLATGFNVFDFIEPDENRLSDVLKFLLDPQGNHGQGSLFLQLLLSRLQLPWSEGDWDATSVRREAPTYRIANFRRRMDLFVNAGALLAIENKVDSLEQSDQVKEYLDHLRHESARTGKRAALIYLTPNGRRPAYTSPSGADARRGIPELQCWSYQDELLAWLIECRQQCEAERIRHFLADFISYIKTRLQRDPEPNDVENDER